MSYFVGLSSETGNRTRHVESPNDGFGRCTGNRYSPAAERTMTYDVPSCVAVPPPGEWMGSGTTRFKCAAMK